MRFSEFVDAYEEQISKVRANKLTMDDLTGADDDAHQPGHESAPSSRCRA